jgi:hypothetical protein
MTRTKTKIGKKKHLNVIKVDFTDLTIFYSREFPRISDHNRNSRIEINRSKDHHVFLKKQPKQYMISPVGRGVIDKPNYITNTLKRTLFTINIKFLVEFLEMFQKTISMPIDTLLSENPPLCLMFLTELYEINFIEYQKNMKKEDFRALLSNCLNFSNMNKLNEEKDCKRMYYKLNNKIVGFKISFSELLYQLTVMHNFSFFYFTWFADYRLRVNYSGSALNLSIPLARIFMQYHARVDVLAIELEKVKMLLKEQLKSISKSKTFLSVKNPTLENCLLQSNHKLRESFLYRHLQNDLKHCHERTIYTRA